MKRLMIMAIIVTAGVLMPSVASAQEPVERQVFLIPITATRYQRVNILINSNTNIPEKVWAQKGFQDFCGALSGAFPVRVWIWRYDLKIWAEGTRVWLWGHNSSIRIDDVTRNPLYAARKGDVVAIEATPAVMRGDCKRIGAGVGICGPAVELIDNRTQDPATFYPKLGTIETVLGQ